MVFTLFAMSLIPVVCQSENKVLFANLFTDCRIVGDFLFAERQVHMTLVLGQVLRYNTPQWNSINRLIDSLWSGSSCVTLCFSCDVFTIFWLILMTSTQAKNHNISWALVQTLPCSWLLTLIAVWLCVNFNLIGALRFFD